MTSGLAHAGDRPHLNVYADAKAVSALSASSQKDVASKSLGYVSSRDPKRGVPTFFWAPKYGPKPPALIATNAESSARWYLENYASLYGLSKKALKTAVVSQVHDLGRGAIIVVFHQRVDGIDVIRNDVKVLMNRNGELVAISGNLHPSAVSGLKRGRSFKVSPNDAVAIAFNDLNGTKIPGSAILSTKETKADYGYFELAETAEVKAQGLTLSRPRAKRVFFPMPDRLVSAYYVEFMSGKKSVTESDAYAYIVAADDGRLLYRQDLTENAAFKYRVWTDNTAPYTPISGPQADFTPHPTGMPDGSSPAFIPPIDITMDGFNTNANNTFDPWLAAGATETWGNNVDAYADHNAPDGLSASDFRASTTAAGEFLRTYDTAQDPLVTQDQSMAAIAHLFYVNNWLHDWYYDSGFDEKAANAQKSNFNRGGVEGDELHAEAQDSPASQANNANMSSLSDGEHPRMQMYVWTGPDTRSLTVNATNYDTNTAAFGPQNFNVTGALSIVNDGTAPTGDGCETIGNNPNINGKIAIIDRGNCNFTVKVKNAQQKGALGVIIANNAAGTPPGMAGSDPSITIPVLSVTQADGTTLKGLIGTNATMQRQVGTTRDGTIDNDIVSHEWGHYLHHRLVLCGSKMCGGMSEGWADFVALHMAIRPNDDLTGTYGMAAYATAILGDSGYFGIRRYPYSVDMTKSPLTFKHVTTNVPLPMGVPIQPAAADNAEVHNVGEIWALFLFEGYLNLLGETKGASPRYTFDQARRLMSDYIVAGMKLAPVEPTFLEQRDAILAAAAASEPKDAALLGQGFAKRGAGTCAETPPTSSTDFQGVVEDFNIRPNMVIASVEVDDSVKSCDTDGILDGDEIGKVKVKLRNSGGAPLMGASATVSTTTPGVTFPNGATITFPTVDAYTETVGMLDIAVDKSVMQKIAFDVKVDATAADGCVTMLTDSLAGDFNYDNVPNSASNDDVESSLVTWAAVDDMGMPSNGWARTMDMASNHLWHGNDDAGVFDYRLESPTLDVGMGAPFVISFKHAHDFEADAQANWDGAVIELSEDNGMTWNDISQYGNPGYGGSIGDPAASNPLLGRQGFVGQSTGYPAMQTKTIDLGTSLAGKSVKIRFRIGSDEAVGAGGWDIDDLQFQGITNKPFATVTDDATTCMLPPNAVATASQASVDCGNTVTLDASGSTDWENDPLTFNWTQVSGPNVTLTGANTATATFTAPDVTADTVLTFQVEVSDGTGTSGATVDVTVKAGANCGGSGTGGNGTGGGGGSGPKGGDPADDGGCGCSVAGDDTAGLKLAPLAALAAAAFFRRRRQGKRAKRG